MSRYKSKCIRMISSWSAWTKKLNFSWHVTWTLWRLETSKWVLLQTVKTQMICHITWNFIRVCTVCLDKINLQRMKYVTCIFGNNNLWPLYIYNGSFLLCHIRLYGKVVWLQRVSSIVRWENKIEEPTQVLIIIDRGQKYFNIVLVLQERWLTIFTRPVNTCTTCIVL